jgi:hypothetical protein
VDRASAIRLFALHEATISDILVVGGGGGLSLLPMVTGRRNYSTKTVHIASLQAITSPAIQSIRTRVGGVSSHSVAAFAKRSFA